MTLLPGCRFAVAPHFHLLGDWSSRLLIGAGIAETKGGFFPLASWRPPTADELSLLVEPTPPANLEDAACLFLLPQHLRAEWWQWLERTHESNEAGAPSAQAPFSDMVQRIGEFLAFKQLPVPDGARWDAVISDPTQLLTPWCLDGRHSGGLRCSVAPWVPATATTEPHWPSLWGGINLGEEPTSLVVINLPLANLAAEWRRRYPEQPTPAAASELAECFLRSCSDYAPVRLLLGAGEGVRLPQGGLILAGYPGGKEEPEMVLLISRGTN